MSENTERYGPNGETVAALIEKARNLTSEQAEALGTAWYSVSSTAWTDAWYAAWNATRSAAREAARRTARDAAIDAAWDTLAEVDAAWDAVWDAACALVVRDRISGEHFRTLYGPWASVMDNEKGGPDGAQREAGSAGDSGELRTGE